MLCSNARFLGKYIQDELCINIEGKGVVKAMQGGAWNVEGN